MAELEHKPVLLAETLEMLAVREGGIYVDCTLGAGGHAREILASAGRGGRLIGIDKDQGALDRAREVLAPFPGQVTYVARDFRYLQDILRELEIFQVDGILFDLGVSTFQVLDPQRGFSYVYDAPLDMRMDQTGKITASDLVNNLNEKELAGLIFRYGEEKWARRIASMIVARRKKAPIKTTGQLVEIIKTAIPAPARRRGPHPAKRTFQALRIAVNDELTGLTQGLQAGIPFLGPGGRIVVISFHSLEDRIVKNIFRDFASPCICTHQENLTCQKGILRVLTKKPLTPAAREVKLNPRARSAKLRAAERIVPVAGVLSS
ncbi:MAG: 16S rRNA (cytosine(1402)-N(4))-methyltransferase RsmH [Bacillota bacterium]|nr:16S rRNA (cytosine(1402)-N(4))-methyltransferase RsmH [Bacillota bacterium]